MGIDEEEGIPVDTDDDGETVYGQWETSGGAKFGKEKLDEIRELFHKDEETKGGMKCFRNYRFKRENWQTKDLWIRIRNIYNRFTIR